MPQTDKYKKREEDVTKLRQLRIDSENLDMQIYCTERAIEFGRCIKCGESLFPQDLEHCADCLK